jgi:hydroxyacylglutathione hydrolase
MKPNNQAAIQVIPIPVFEDNYIFLLARPDLGRAFVVDPALAEPVLNELSQRALDLQGILNTHHHRDHIGGNKDLIKVTPTILVYGCAKDAARIPGINRPVADGSLIECLGTHILVKETPGHTIGHIVYIMNPDTKVPDLFCGDTLFGGGCGKLFEGDAEQMLESLATLRSLPDETRVWCAHEYTEKNYQVAAQLEPENSLVQEWFQKIRSKRSRNEPTVPLRLGDEKRTNPFLRWDDPALAHATSTSDPLNTFKAVRAFRDRF